MYMYARLGSACIPANLFPKPRATLIPATEEGLWRRIGLCEFVTQRAPAPAEMLRKAHCRRLERLYAHTAAAHVAVPAASVDTVRLNVEGTGISALRPDPWTNTPDGKGTGGGELPAPLVMTDEELYLFDLHGYLVVPQVLGQDTVALLNQHIDANLERVHTRDLQAGSLDGRDEPIHGGVAAPAMTGTHGRGDFGGFLWDWGEPAGAAFRSLIANEHAMRIAIGVIGDAFRLAGSTGLLQTKGAEGFVLHGGGNPDNMFAVCISILRPSSLACCPCAFH